MRKRVVGPRRAGLAVGTALALCLTGCGGGDSSGSGGGGSAVVPPPSPSPTPSPSPSPSERPVTYSVMAAGPFIGSASWTDPALAIGARPSQATSALGRIGPGITPINPASSPGTVPVANVRDFRTSFGADALTAMIYSEIETPDAARIVSPLTAIARYRRFGPPAQLGLTSGPLALGSGTDPLFFDPWAELSSADPVRARDAGRLISVNVQLVALAGLLRRFDGDPLAAGYGFDTMGEVVGAVLADGRQLDLTNPTDIETLLRRRFAERSPGKNWQPTAQLMARYMAAVPPVISDPAVARGWLYVFRFHVFADLIALDRTNGQGVSEIAPLSTEQMATLAAQLEQIEPQSRGGLFAVPDYIELTDKTLFLPGRTVVPYQVTMDGCEARDARLPTCNDFNVFGATENPALASIDAFDPSALSVTRQGATLVVRRAVNFAGLAIVRYRMRASDGTELVGTLFVRVRSPEASRAVCSAGSEWCQL